MEAQIWFPVPKNKIKHIKIRTMIREVFGGRVDSIEESI